MKGKRLDTGETTRNDVCPGNARYPWGIPRQDVASALREDLLVSLSQRLGDVEGEVELGAVTAEEYEGE